MVLKNHDMKVDKVKLLTTLVVILLLINITTLAGIWRMMDWNNMRLMPPPPPSPKDFIINKLGLDDEQQKVFEELRNEHFTQMSNLREEIKSEKSELYDLLKNPQIDTNATYKHFASIMSKEERLERITFEHFRKLRNVCNDEQKQHFDVIIDKVLNMVMHGPKPAQPHHGMHGAHSPAMPPLP
jgi:protein CpxP